MAGIQQVRYDTPAPPNPGFMDYAAQFLTSYMGAKDKAKEQKSKELMTLLPALAAQGQVTPGGPINFGGQNIGITPRPEDTQDAYRNMQIRKTGLELGLPGYEPTEAYLQTQSQDEADKQLNRNFRFQMLSTSARPSDQAQADTIRKTRAQQIYNQMKTGYGMKAGAGEPAPTPIPAERVAYLKSKLKRGYVAVVRDGVEGQVPAGEVLPTDQRL